MLIPNNGTASTKPRRKVIEKHVMIRRIEKSSRAEEFRLWRSEGLMRFKVFG
jgi:hypothetical protein